MKNVALLLICLSTLLQGCARAPEKPNMSCSAWVSASEEDRNQYVEGMTAYYEYEFRDTEHTKLPNTFREDLGAKLDRCEDLNWSPSILAMDAAFGRNTRPRGESSATPTSNRFGGLTIDSSCSAYNNVSASVRQAFIADIVAGTSMNRGIDYRPYTSEIQACVAAALRQPCAPLDIGDALTVCFATAGP